MKVHLRALRYFEGRQPIGGRWKSARTWDSDAEHRALAWLVLGPGKHPRAIFIRGRMVARFRDNVVRFFDERWNEIET